MPKKRNQKEFYKKMQKVQNRTQMIQDGLKGFLCTCKTGTEKRCIKEVCIRDVLIKFTRVISLSSYVVAVMGTKYIYY